MIQKMIKSCGTLILTGALVMGLGVEVSAAEKAASLSLSKDKVAVSVGKSFTVKTNGKAKIKVTVSPKTAGKKIVVSSDSQNIMVKKLSDHGYKITGKASGSAVVQVSSADNGAVTKSFTVEVKAKKRAERKVKTLVMADFEKEIQKAKGRVAIMFGTEWCHYCQLLDPIYNEAGKKSEKVQFYRVDADKEQELSALFGITAYPYVYLLENDKTIDVTGYMRGWSADDYVKWAHEKKVPVR